MTYFRKLAVAVAAAGAVLAGGLSALPAAAAPAAAPAAANRCAQKVTWKNTRTGLYLDAKGGGGKHTPVVTWYRNGGSNQKWCLERVAGSQYNEWYFHPSYNTRLCMDVPGGNYYTGAKVVLWTCNGRQNQRFEITHTSGSSFFSPDGDPVKGYYNLGAGGAGQSVTLVPSGSSKTTMWR
ncbi:RICIN domain-containing protein [Streptomyces sp. NPDC093260]|uniref:RICIN domain-containing protein n=1 Tax=Streptomyces sp. NPDC093260 TaxID=3155073 RepID=UPI0034336479